MKFIISTLNGIEERKMMLETFQIYTENRWKI